MLHPLARLLLTACLLVPAPALAAAPIRIVAAERVYADVASQIGGNTVAVTAILSNPDQDPHLFEASPSVARALARADIAIANGAGYDSWMTALLRATRRRGRVVIVAARLIGRRRGDNPHIWYDPTTMPAFARRLAATLENRDPVHAAADRGRLAAFEASMAPIETRIALLRARLAGTPVAATEPVFDDMLRALGMTVLEGRFQIAVMNATEPSAADIAAFETDLRERRVRLLVTNAQVADPIARRMARIAREAGIPVLPAAETEPPGMSYQRWMLAMLAAVERALPPAGGK
ncbi:MAG: zinc ABC transporter substrate-binding protein [Rhodospirillales bacterium]|nr:zinc ABC transporter substrate-binding protein [Rhodospirillales bacterium]